MRALVGLLVAVCGAVLTAQAGRPKVELATIAEVQAVHPGTQVRLALQVHLPEGIHVQADRPRDPLLIATLLTLVPAAGVTPIEIVYPDTMDFRVEGQTAPLAVFEERFDIGAKVAVAADVSGTLVVPGRLRYQACNASTCFAPTTEDVRWTLPVAPVSAPLTRQFADVFATIEFKR